MYIYGVKSNRGNRELRLINKMYTIPWCDGILRLSFMSLSVDARQWPSRIFHVRSFPLQDYMILPLPLLRSVKGYFSLMQPT